jgi:hypothetical protein
MLLSFNYCAPPVPEPEESELLNELAGPSAVWKETLSRRVQVPVLAAWSPAISHTFTAVTVHTALRIPIQLPHPDAGLQQADATTASFLCSAY